MATKTLYVGLNKPTVDSDEDTWGDLLNADFDVIDTYLNEIIQSRKGQSSLQDKITSVDNNISALQNSIVSTTDFLVSESGLLSEVIALVAGYNRDCICEVPPGAVFGVDNGVLRINGVICNFSKKIIKIPSEEFITLTANKLIYLEYDPNDINDPIKLKDESLGPYDFVPASKFGAVGNKFQIPVGETDSSSIFKQYFINREYFAEFSEIIDLTSVDFLSNQWPITIGPGTFPKKIDVFIKAYDGVSDYKWIKASPRCMVPVITRTGISFNAISQNLIPGDPGKGIYVRKDNGTYTFYKKIVGGFVYIKT